MADTSQSDLAAEVQSLRQLLIAVQGEIAAIRHPRSTEDRITAATQELEAIVTATEAATNGILAIAEAIGQTADGIAIATENPDIHEAVNRIGELVGNLFTECAFQDITGQRVNKVVNTLNFVENRITTVIGAFGPQFEAVTVPDYDSGHEEAHLLNGPQRGRPGVEQADIDALFG